MYRLIFAALGLYIPFTTLYPQSDIPHAAFRVAICLAALTGVGLPKGKLVRWGLALWGAGIVWSVVAAPDPWRALWSTHNRNEGAWQVAHYLVALLVLVRAPREGLAKGVALAALSVASLGVFPIGWVNGRLAGTAGNPLYLAPLAIVGIWGAWRAGGRWRALAPVLALVAGLTMSKGVALALVAAAGVWLLHRGSQNAIAAVGVVAAVGIWFIPVPDSGLIRLELGRVALAGIAAQPLGWGAEGFPLAWDQFWTGAAPTGEVWHDRAHCLPLDRAIEWGVVGFAGWALVAIAVWRRAELLERMALAAWGAYHLTMFEMMWGAAGYAAVAGYVFSLEPRSRVMNKPLAWTGLAVALVVGGLALRQSWAGLRAADDAAARRTIEMWSPIGSDLIELYLKRPQTPESLEWADDFIETSAPHRTQQLVLMAWWDRAWCVDLLAVAPRRPDMRALCER